MKLSKSKIIGLIALLAVVGVVCGTLVWRQSQPAPAEPTEQVSITGYLGGEKIGLFDDAKFKALKVDGVEPKAENVESGDFKIWSYEHMYTAASPDEATKAFLEYMMGEEVQCGLVEQQGYIPLSGMKVEKDASGQVSNK